MTNLTELEGTVLGVVWAGGPLTPYAIRSEFAKSRSSHFSGSAGAIYPLLERLEHDGLVRAADHKRGSRKSRLFSITPGGKNALRAWLSHTEQGLSTVEFDPIRTRVHFLGILTPRQRQRFIGNSIEQLHSEIEATKILIEEKREAGDTWGTWGAKGVLRALKARLIWLADIQGSE